MNQLLNKVLLFTSMKIKDKLKLIFYSVFLLKNKYFKLLIVFNICKREILVFKCFIFRLWMQIMIVLSFSVSLNNNKLFNIVFIFF